MECPTVRCFKQQIFFTISLGLSGVIFGYNIGLFNFLYSDDEKVCFYFKDTITDNNHDDYCYDSKNLNFIFSFGGVFACLIGGPIIRNIGRRHITTMTIILNSLATAFQVWQIGKFFMYSTRFVIGFCCTFYTFISPITFREYILGKQSSKLMSSFYIGIATGIFLAFIIFKDKNTINSNQNNSIDYTENKGLIPLLLIPLYLEFIRIPILLFFFSESPRFRALQLLKQNPKWLKNIEGINDSSMSSDPKNFGKRFGLEELREDEEDLFSENIRGSNIESVNSHLNESGERMERLLNTLGEDFQNALENDKQILEYFEKFYKKGEFRKAFIYFFVEFKNTIQIKFIQCNPIFSPYTMGATREYRLQFFVIGLLNFLNQMTGINCLIFYGSKIFTNIAKDKVFILTCLIGSYYFIEMIIFRDFQSNRFNCRIFFCKFYRSKRTYLLGLRNPSHL